MAKDYTIEVRLKEPPYIVGAEDEDEARRRAVRLVEQIHPGGVQPDELEFVPREV